MNYKKFNCSQYKPTGKQNCICWLENSEKVACYYHKKKDCFLGRYGNLKGKRLDVIEWSYAILPKRQSHLFEESLLQMSLSSGDNEFKIQFGMLDSKEQERLYNEIELIRASVLHWFKKYS